MDCLVVSVYTKSLRIVIIIINISGQILAREWTKYECGVFSELGYKDDRLYPARFRAGNDSRPTAGQISDKTSPPVFLLFSSSAFTGPPELEYNDKYQFNVSKMIF